MMIGSDGIPDLNGLPHPRLFGTFPRIYAEYMRARPAHHGRGGTPDDQPGG